jgi:Domain of unknown function (DUF4349)
MSANEMTIGTVLRAHAPRAPESLRARVLELEPRRTPSRKLVLVLAAALALAVAAAIVHGLVSSGPNEKPAPLMAKAPAAAPAETGHRAVIPSIASAPTRLQHTEASLEVRVADVSSATTRATQVATSLGGYAESVTYSSSSHTSSLVLRVPVQNVKTAIARLGGLGAIVSQDLSVTDLEHDLQAESAQIAQLRRTIATLQAALRDPSLPDAQRVILRIRLANAKRALTARLRARSGTIAAGTTARISLLLETKSAVVPLPHHRGRLGRMLHSAVGFLGLEGTIALYALIVLSPLALAAALVWGLREARRRRDERLVME